MNLKPIRNYVAATVLGGAAALGMTSCVDNGDIKAEYGSFYHDDNKIRYNVETMKKCFNALDALEKDTVDFSHCIEDYLNPDELELCGNVFNEIGVDPSFQSFQKFKEEFCKIADRFLKADSALRAAKTPADSIAMRDEFDSAKDAAAEALGLPTGMVKIYY